MKKLVLLVLSTSSLIGCMRGGSSDGEDSAPAAVDSEEAVSSESDLLIANVDGASPAGMAAPDAATVSATITANVTARWAGNCATAVQNGANITITYNDCSGPRGLVHVTGELDLTISIGANAAIDVHATSTDLEVNGATLDFTADGVFTTSGTMESLAVTANGTGTGPFGNSIDHNGAYTVTWDPSTTCRSIDGSWSTDFSSPVATAERANTVDLTRCGTSCPTGTLTHKFLGGASLSLTFDGTATAKWALSTGASGSVLLGCTP
ncbi:MAG TPA: hypothetical protein VGL61_25595 [Kofleriaceae bacterium]|jgi:hypothetical protein